MVWICCYSEGRFFVDRNCRVRFKGRWRRKKRRTTRFKKLSNFDSFVRWDVAEQVERSGDWMIQGLDDVLRGEKMKKDLRVEGTDGKGLEPVAGWR
jgi:hypothetical protein